MPGAWLIWKQRNDTIFSRCTTTFQGWKWGFIEEALLQANRMKHDNQVSFSSFISLPTPTCLGLKGLVVVVVVVSVCIDR
jgi:hypothetical protein